jgi:CRP-like cAMP-binding protein
MITSQQMRPFDTRQLLNNLAGSNLEVVQQFNKAVNPKLLANFADGFVRRRDIATGQCLFHEGDFGSHFFIVERGTFGIFQGMVNRPGRDPDRRTRRDRLGNWFARFTRRPPKENLPQPIPPSDRLMARIGEGEILGEATCINFYPRPSSALALENCTVLEVDRIVLEHLPSGPFRERLERIYRERALPDYLRRNILLAPLRSLPDHLDRVVADLARHNGVDLLRYAPKQVVYRQGEVAKDGLYTIGIGHVKVSKQWPGGESTLDFLGPSDHFGEVAILPKLLDVRTGHLPETRTVTCTALDHVELVRIRPDTLHLLPGLVRKPLIEAGFKRLGRS